MDGRRRREAAKKKKKKKHRATVATAARKEENQGSSEGAQLAQLALKSVDKLGIEVHNLTSQTSI